ncbi:MAG: glycerate kinase [Bacteroidota bacterium]
MEKQDKDDLSKVVELEQVKRKKELVAAVRSVIDKQPTWGYRRVRAWLVRREGWEVSNKTIQKVFQEHGWQVKSTNKTPRPRVKSSSSVASQPNERWAIDATSCWSKSGWVGVMAVIDCCTREIVGVHVSERGQHAIEQGIRQINLFIGGSATNDAAIGIAHAIGHRFYDAAGQVVTPVGGNLVAIDRIELVELPRGVHFQVICDVANPFFGPSGAAHVYARQKGANDREISTLDSGLRQINQAFIKHDLPDVGALPGAGAAGGTGGGMKALFNATLIEGFDWFCQQLDIETKVQNADVVITGEGQLDDSSLSGKVVGGFSKLCQKHGKKLVVICGVNRLSSTTLAEAEIAHVEALMDHAKNVDQAMKETAKLISAISSNWRLAFKED